MNARTSRALPKVGSFTDFGDSAHFGWWDQPSDVSKVTAPRPIPRSELKVVPPTSQFGTSPKSPYSGSPTSPLEGLSTTPPALRRSTVTRGDNVWHSVFNPGTNKAMSTKVGSSKFDRPAHKDDMTVWDMYLKATPAPEPQSSPSSPCTPRLRPVRSLSLDQGQASKRFLDFAAETSRSVDNDDSDTAWPYTFVN